MTAKRFQWVYIKDNLLELRDNGIIKVFNNERLEELLNELHEENEQLKKDCTALIYHNQEYRKENEQLKQQLRDCEKFRHTVYQEISKEMSKHD